MTLPSNPVHSKLEYNIIPLPSPKCESVNTYGSNVDKQNILVRFPLLIY